MQVEKEQLTPTTVKLTIIADLSEIQAAKTAVVTAGSKSVKVPGFRPGHAPLSLVEKNIEPTVLQSQVIDEVLNNLYFKAVSEQKLRPVTQPSITLTKFVPFTAMEFTAEVEVVGDVSLPDYTKIKLEVEKPSVSAQDVSEVLENLRQRAAERSKVDRAAKLGDELIIDFAGVDSKTGEPITGADGKSYPLTLGSGSFIPGFEEELVGAKPGAVKTFDITFPSDYGVSSLQKKKVTFTVTTHTINELQTPKLDDEFAKKSGPFEKLTELKADIKKQLLIEKERDVNQKYINQLLEKISAKTTVAIPASLVEEEIDRMENEEKQNLVYRGQTWEEHLAEEGITAEEHRNRQREGAEARLKNSLILGEIADRQQITVTPEELEIRVQMLKGRYTDQPMQDELDKPENLREVHSRMITDKTYDYLLSLAK